MVVGRDLAAGLDPCRFARACGVVPDDWQTTVLRSRADRLLLNCSRQSGKSLTCAILAAWTVVYRPGALVLMLAPSERQSKEIFRKALDVYAATGRAIPADSETRSWLELSNGSRLLSLPGSQTTTRGFSAPSLILADEASRCDDELFYSLLPMLAVSKGRMICLSTPAGQRGFFHDQWIEEGDAWQRIEIPADRCPRIDPVWLEAQRRTMPRAWFDQEFGCRFTQIDDAVFSYEDVAGILTDDAPVFPQLVLPGPWSGTVGAGGPE